MCAPTHTVSTTVNQCHKMHDEPATWSEGDWNGDGCFSQSDAIAALATGNYMQGPYAAAADSLVKPSQDAVEDPFAALD